MRVPVRSSCDRPKLWEPAESGSIGWMPESGRALGERDKSVESHSRDRGEGDFRPYHVDRHASRFRRNTKADALRRRPEKFADDSADHGHPSITLHYPQLNLQ